MTPSTAPAFPPGRYGKRREPRRSSRPALVLLLVPVVLVAIWLAFTLYQKYGNPAYSPQVIGYTDITDQHITVRFSVHKTDGRAAICRIKAQDRSGAEIGYAEVPVGPGTDVTLSYTLTTKGRPIAVDVLGCTAAP